MVTTLNSSNTNIYSTENDKRYSGVVIISTGGYYGTGALLYDGAAILTAAHLFSDVNSQARITFDSPSGSITLQSSNITIIPTYDDINSNSDIAIVWLSEQAPKDALRYDIYRETNEINQIFSFAGYGVQGTGMNGVDDINEALKLASLNRFEEQASELKDALGNIMAWNPNNNILIADFDDGTTPHDALGKLLNIHDLGTGSYEGIISHGDSGGPAFIDSKIAGVASYGATLQNSAVNPDVDDQNNSSFGELGFWQRISSYQQFIDESIRANYKNQPQTAQDIQKQIIEGDSNDIAINYFFLEIIGLRNSDEIINVKFATRDGTATSNEDYIPISGQIMVYPNEGHVLIPVEILGDTLKENDEIFYLDIFDPVGASFENDVLILTAQRTIIDNDSYFV